MDDEGLGLELSDLEIAEVMEEPQMMAAGGSPRKKFIRFDQVKTTYGRKERHA